MSERTKAGLQRTGSAGKLLGTPRVEVDVLKLRAPSASAPGSDDSVLGRPSSSDGGFSALIAPRMIL